MAANGAVVAVLEDNEANYINMYSKEGTKIYSIKTTVSGDGYPLDAVSYTHLSFTLHSIISLSLKLYLYKEVQMCIRDSNKIYEKWWVC